MLIVFIAHKTVWISSFVDEVAVNLLSRSRAEISSRKMSCGKYPEMTWGQPDSCHAKLALRIQAYIGEKSKTVRERTSPNSRGFADRVNQSADRDRF
jgi:hypothetical protein